MIISMGLGFSSCKEERPDPSYFAGIAAKGYYDLLLEGKYEEYVAGFNQPYRIPKGYHDQLSKVDILSAKADTARHVADVFLRISYGDSTKEQIIVPMIEVKGEWKMR